VAVPTGLSGSAAIALVQAYANEPNLPSISTVLTFLNRGVEQVAQRINGIMLTAAYPTVPNQTYIQLASDVQYIESANFSTGASNTTGFITNSSPLVQGTLVYPMVQLSQAQFMDAAAGFPAVGFGPPQAFFIFEDQGFAPSTTLPVPAAPTMVTSTGGISTASPIYVQLTYVNANGETSVSPTAKQALANQLAVVLSPQGVSNATGYNVYVSTTNAPGSFYLQNASPTTLGTAFTIPATPTTGTANPPVSNLATGSGTGGALFMQLYPAAMIGQVNIYYRARPQLWADTTVNSYTNLDTMAQEAVVVYAVMRVLQARGRGGEAKGIWMPEYESHVERLKADISKRTRPQAGRVRDVYGRAFPSAPPWLTG
jgi:hypothetical protein